MTLNDKLNRPLQDLRISVIDRCNFRCTYCMPEDEQSHYQFLKEKDWLSFAEITRLVGLFVSLGVKKIRLTGGEPLLRPNLASLVNQLSQHGVDDLALTTNGSLLGKYAADLRVAGLKRLTVSLDTIDSRIFKHMSGGKGSAIEVLSGIKKAKDAGFPDIKINIVVQRGVNDHTVLDLVEYFKGTGHILRFIEYMDVGNCNHWESKYVVPSKEILRIIQKRYPLKPAESNYFGEVAERYEFVDGTGEIGLISSVSQPFCQSCTRARLSTDGKLYTCLFTSDGIDLRTPLRSGATDEDLLQIIESVWQKREDRYSELRAQMLAKKVVTHKIEMFQIGG